MTREVARLDNPAHEPGPRPTGPQETVEPQVATAHPAGPGGGSLVLRNPQPQRPIGAKAVQATPELELRSTPQLAPVALSVVGHMVASAFEERVPPGLIAPLRRALDIDLARVPIRRGDAVSATAQRLGARAFTADGAVYLPDDAGAVESTDTAPLLAHELTHAAQQEHFGVTMPGLATVTGQHLEHDAVAMEQWVRDGAVGPPPVVYGSAEPEPLEDVTGRVQAAPRLPVVPERRTRTESALDRFRQEVPGMPAPSNEIVDASPSGLLARMRRQGVALPAASNEIPDASPAGLLARMRRQGVTLPAASNEIPDASPAGLLDRVRRHAATAQASSSGLPLAASGVVFERLRRQNAVAEQADSPSGVDPDPAVTGMVSAIEQVATVSSGSPSVLPDEPPDEPPGDVVTYGPDRPPPGWPRGSAVEEPLPSSEPPRSELTEFIREVRDNPPRRWLDLDDPDHFAEISHRVYNTLQARLRFDVLLERERNGTLMDFS